MNSAAYATGRDDADLRHKQGNFQRWLEMQLECNYNGERPRTIRAKIPDEYAKPSVYTPVLSLITNAIWRAWIEHSDAGEAFVVLDCGQVPVSPV